MRNKELKYKEAGVDIDKGSTLVEKVRAAAESTRRPEWMDSLGGFGALFRLDLSRFRHPVLVSGTDGVGTKLRIAKAMNNHGTVGIDLVAMCVNDVLACGAEPLFFLDYLAVGSLSVDVAAEIIKGIAEGCRQAGCSLVGGETAEMPGFYPPGDYELAGFTVGAVEEDRILTGQSICSGDRIIGLASNGVHSNGFSLVRAILGDDLKKALSREAPWGGITFGEELLKPTAIYVKAVLPLLEGDAVHCLAHITGGGLMDNVLRVLPADTEAVLDKSSWPAPPIFKFIQEAGKVEDDEMRRVFNMGIGYVLIVSEGREEEIVRKLAENGHRAYLIGQVEKGTQQVRFV